MSQTEHGKLNISLSLQAISKIILLWGHGVFWIDFCILDCKLWKFDFFLYINVFLCFHLQTPTDQPTTHQTRGHEQLSEKSVLRDVSHFAWRSYTSTSRSKTEQNDGKIRIVVMEGSSYHIVVTLVIDRIVSRLFGINSMMINLNPLILCAYCITIFALDDWICMWKLCGKVLMKM